MAIRKAHSRPYCVDLTPSAYVAARPEKRFGTSAANSLLSINRTSRSTSTHSGAIRRSGKSDTKSAAYLATLTTTAIAIIGAVAWASNFSNTTESDVAQVAADSSARSTNVAPSFFFDDATDALERTTSPANSEPTADVALIERKVSPQLPELAAAFGTRPIDFSNNEPQQSENESVPDPLKSPLPGDFIEPPSARNNAYNEDLNDQIVAVAPESDDFLASNTKKVKVASGDTLSGILNAHGLPKDQMNLLLSNDVVKQYLVDISIGQVMELMYDDDGSLSGLSSKVTTDKRINVHRTPTGFEAEAKDLLVDRQRAVASGSIEQSFFLAAERASIKQSTIMALANIFQWELDFARDIQQGDKFSLVYERLYRENEYIGDGDILAAEFIRGGKAYKAIRVVDDNGDANYYSPDGASMRRTFMRHPVDVVRITSKFNPNRLHPVLHKIRAHRGVDYGAPYGSPIYATADGKVTFSGTNGAYGNTVILQHGDKFSTLYAHMSKISEKSITGTRVKQGDVIGYVGKTGRVTGTHLHYEFRVDGVQIDPLKVELPVAAPLDEAYMAKLHALTDEMSELMDNEFDNLDEQVATAVKTDSNL